MDDNELLLTIARQQVAIRERLEALLFAVGGIAFILAYHFRMFFWQ